MKKLLLGVTLLATTFAFGQSNEAGTIQLGLGWGMMLGGASIESTYTFNDEKVTSKSSGVGAMVNYGIRAQYGITELISAGIFIRKEGAVYVVTPDDFDNESFDMSVSTFAFGIEPKVYLVNNDKFNLNVAPSIGFSTGSTEVIDFGFTTEGSASGLNYGFTTGINWYFANMFGMSADLGYAGNSLSGSFDDAPDGSEYKIKGGGFYLGMGLTVKF